MLKLYDFKTLKFKGVIDNFIEAKWQVDYNSASDFSILTSINDKNDYQLHDIIYDSELDDACFIQTLIFEDEKIKIVGVGVSEILKNRINLNKKDYKGSLKGLIREVFNSFQSRILPFFALENLNFDDKIVNFNLKNDDIYTIFEQISIENDLGFKVFFNKNKQFLINFYKGKNKTKDQNENKKLIFSKKFDNILKTNFTVSISNYKTTCYVFEEEKNILKIKNDNLNGFERKEVFKSSKFDETKYKNLDDFLETEARLELLNRRQIKDLKVEINPQRINYLKDFNLGDLATIVDEDFGIVKNIKIVGFTYQISKSEKRCGVILE